MAQQKCTKLCHGILGPIPRVPGVFGGRCATIWEFLSPFFQCFLTIGARFSRHQISPNFAQTNPPTAGSPGALLPEVLLGQGSAQHAPGPSIHWDALSRSDTLCSATCDPPGQSRSASDCMPHAPLWGAVVGWRKLQVNRPTDSPSGLVVGHPRPAAGARSTRHTQRPSPPPAQGPQPAREEQRCATVPDPVP